MSHELRTPLTLMLGPVEDALAQPSGSLAGTQLDLVRRNALRLYKMVTTLLDFSRVEAGRAQATFVPTDLAAVTQSLASNFQSAAERAGLQLIVHCPPLPEAIYVDPEMWEKILLDLMMPRMNGTQFCEEARKVPAWARIPIVLLSADSQVKEKAAECNAASYLAKPMKLTALYQAVARALAAND